ncbi:hypothetical protein CDIK_1184 [Cucumispora dikerogammari]|nr:hypothetical protein CDIK_1184 [Cucumispora dikerogammari]
MQKTNSAGALTISHNALTNANNSIIKKQNTLQINKNDTLFDLLSYILYNRNHLSSVNNPSTYYNRKINISKYLKKLYFQRHFFNPNWITNYSNEVNLINDERINEYDNVLNYIKSQNESWKPLISNVWKKYYNILSILYNNIL